MHRKIVLPLLMSGLLLLAGCGGTSTTATSAGPSATSVAPSTGTGASPATPAPGASAGATATATACPTANTTDFAKTKFVLHTGLAFGAFHRYLYKPLKSGSFKAGTGFRRGIAVAKGVAAALFIKREIRLAAADARANPTLCTTVAQPLMAVSDTIANAVNSLKSGNLSGLSDAATAIGTIEGKAKGAGFPITEDPNAGLS